MNTSYKFWSGTAESFNAVLSAASLIEAKHVAYGMATDAPDTGNSMLSKADGVGVITVAGSLITGRAGPFGQMFGVVGYDDIRDAVVQALTDPEVKSLLLSINSGGGAASGADELSRFVASAAKLKPIVVHTDGMLASAAYWLASGASKIVASRTAIVGSIGVLSVHMERSAQLKENGIGVTVIRAGKYKALTNSVEPLSEEALAQAQAQVNYLYDIFISQVADNRGVTMSTADSQMGQGKEFIGKQALTAGLVDNVGTYEQAFALAKRLDNSASPGNNSSKPKGTSMKPKAILTETQLAALAAGATLESLDAGAAIEDDKTVDNPAHTATADNQSSVVIEPGNAVGTTVTASVEVTADTAVVDLLKAQLAEASDSLVASKVETAALKAQVEANKATYDGLLAIARSAVAKMNIALGGNAEAFANASATEVITSHASLQETFNTKFKVGGVAVTAQAEPKPRVYSGMDAAMVQAAKV